jgi:putative aldouronate transport system permease protein
MSIEISQPHRATAVQPSGVKGWAQELWEYSRANWPLFLLGLPGIAIIFLINYVPMFGVAVAFQDYRPQTGFLSEWVGLRNFALLFNSPAAFRIVRNTVLLNAIFLSTGLICAISMALLLNEIRLKWFKRISQSIMFLPFFLSWSVVSVLVEGQLSKDFGALTRFWFEMTGQSVDFYTQANWWPWILMVIRIWKDTGSGCIIYLAMLAGINPELYEAASIDGASRFQRVRAISLPLLIPTAILLTLLAVGRIFYGDAGLLYTVTSPFVALYPTTDIIETYIIRALRTNVNFGLTTAMGLLQSVMGFVFVMGSNWLVKRYSQRRGEDYSLF